MKKSLKFLSVLLFVCSLSSCSLGFLASKNQYVNIQKDSLATLRINDSLPVIKNGKYQVKRKSGSVQLKIEKEGFKDEYRVMIPYKKSGLYYTTFVSNALVFGIPSGLVSGSVVTAFVGAELGILSYGLGSAFFGGSFAYFATLDTRLWEYPKVVNLNIPLKPNILKDSTMKEVYLNKLSIIAAKSDLYIANQSIKKYLKKEEPKYQNSYDSKDIKLENTIFSDEINKILKKNGFIDTSGLVLRGSYKENLFLNATITNLKFLNVEHSRFNYGFTKLTLNTKWDVLDIYKNTLFSDTILLESGEFVTDDDDSKYELMLNDALESGLHTLMSSDKFREAVKISVNNEIDILPNFEIQRSSKFVTSLQEAVSASVTITTKNGHGSGFLISEDGYLITNYHVVADSANLEVVLNDGTKYKARLIQYNKDVDLALLKIEKNGFIPFSIMESESVSIGKDIFVIGTPTAQDLSQTISKGIISSIRKQSNGSKIIQTDASINRGNSGGPLVDKNGNLLGVVNAKLIGVGVEGISFAIPASTIVNALKIQYK